MVRASIAGLAGGAKHKLGRADLAKVATKTGFALEPFRGGVSLAMAMHEMPPGIVHHLRAAEAWLELGDHHSASDELEKVAPSFRAHPVVLVVRYQVLAEAKLWERAFEIADTLVQVVPESGFGWLRRSQALHFMNRTQEAWDKLLPAAALMPGNPLIAYDLACYACQLARLPESKRWLQKAFGSREAQRLKLMALADPDLEPLWQDIGKL